MLFNRLHRLRSKEEDESGTDTLEDIQEEEDIDPENPDGEPKAEEEQEGGAAPEDELIVTIEGEAQEEEDDAKAPHWVKVTRQRNKELVKEKLRLEAELEAFRKSQPKPDDSPPEKPSIGSPEIDYDQDKFDSAMEEYIQKKLAYENKQREARRQQEEAAKEWEAVQQGYVKAKARFPAAKMQEAEDEVVSVLPGPRQAMLMDVADDPAQLVIALGTNPETLRKLATIKSDIKFVKELVKIEGKITVQSKKTPPPPERTISGSGKTPGASANNLEALKERANKSGDWTAYLEAKRKAGK